MDKNYARFTIYYVGETKDGVGENCRTVSGYYNGEITQTMRRAFNDIVKAHGMLWGIYGCVIENIEVEEA